MKLVTIAKVGAPHGVKGDLKLNIFADKPESILQYQAWYIHFNNQWLPANDFVIKPSGSHFLIHFNNCEDRDLARRYVNAELAVSREELDQTESGEYYWTDLEGLEVKTLSGHSLGYVDHLFSTGANDVMVLKGDRERFLPYIKDVIQQVDLENKTITVDWDPEF